MHPVEQDANYQMFVVPGVGPRTSGLNLMIFGAFLHLIFAHPVAGGPVLMAGSHILSVRCSGQLF